ncbi:hypothetical protein KM043_008162 [Ampulex compressa]|nr:hypothetical protein KM043_008162 [Ampulex compressa]
MGPSGLSLVEHGPGEAPGGNEGGGEGGRRFQPLEGADVTPGSAGIVSFAAPPPTGTSPGSVVLLSSSTTMRIGMRVDETARRSSCTVLLLGSNPPDRLCASPSFSRAKRGTTRSVPEPSVRQVRGYRGTTAVKWTKTWLSTDKIKMQSGANVSQASRIDDRKSFGLESVVGFGLNGLVK